MNDAVAGCVEVGDGRLAYHRWPAAHVHRTSLVLLHGFTGCAQAWAPLARRWSADRDVIAFDLPGHGATEIGTTDAPCDMAGFACAVDGALDRLGIERFDLLGYSLGARTALYLALAGGDVSRRLRRLVLESAGAGLQTPEQRASRRRADAELIALLLEAGIERFVERWESTPVLAGQRNLPDDERRRLRELRLACAADGLAASLAGMGTGAQPWLGDALASLDRPTLCLAGADDAKFAALAERLASAIPDCRVALLANCGHSPHLEDPESYFTVVDGFLAAGDDHDATLDAH